METVYAAADLVLLTSDNEGMPVSLIEAGLAGLPAVATRVGSVAEVIEDGRTGLLGPCDVSQLARRVVRLTPRRRAASSTRRQRGSTDSTTLRPGAPDLRHSAAI